MNTQKAVYNRLFAEAKKTELETHKVELGLIDDMANLKKSLLKDLAKSNKADEQVKKAAAKLKDASEFWLTNKKFAQNVEKTANKMMDKFEKAAKDLGLDVKGSQASKDFYDILDITSQIQDNIDSIVSNTK